VTGTRFSQPAVEALDEGVLDRLARGDVVPGDVLPIDQTRIAVEVSSVPLSETMPAGRPRTATLLSSSRATRMSEIEASASSARHSRV
jgi:hypothetical protein